MLKSFPRVLRSSGSAFILAASIFWGNPSLALAAEDPTGDWQVEDGVAVIRVAECHGALWGAVSWEKTPGGLDKNNPDKAKRSRPTLGMPILLEMKKSAKGDEWAGQVYNAKDGKLYKSTVKPISKDELEIEGCVLGILCGGQTWTRVGPPIPSSPVNTPVDPMASAAPAAKSSAPAGAKPAPKTDAKAAKSDSKTIAAPAAPAKGATTPAASGKAAAGSPAAAQPADQIGDICLLPGIARLAH